MAIKLSDLGSMISVQNQLSDVIQKIQGQIKALNAAALKKFGQMMTGAAISLPLKASIEASDQLETHIGRLAAAMGNVPDKAGRLAQAHKLVADQANATGYDMNKLTGALYRGVAGFIDMQQPMAAASDAAKTARSATRDLADTTAALITTILNLGNTTRTPIRIATTFADIMAALQTRLRFTNISDLTLAMKEAAPAAIGMRVSLGQTMASLGGLSGKTAGLREIVTQLSKASSSFDIFAGPNGQGIEFLKTLRGIQDRFGDISHNEGLTATFEQAFGASAGSHIQIMLQHLEKARDALNRVRNSAEPVGHAQRDFEERGSIGFEKLRQAIVAIEVSIGQALLPKLALSIPRAFNRSVNLLKGFAKGIASATLAPVHTMDDVVTKLRSHLPFSPATAGPPRGLNRVRIAETLAGAIQPVPLLAAIRRMAMVSTIAAPMMIGTATMPAIAARPSATSAAPNLVYAPQVTVHAIGADAATVEKAVLEALRKHKDEVARILDQVHERRERTKF